MLFVINPLSNNPLNNLYFSVLFLLKKSFSSGIAEDNFLMKLICISSSQFNKISNIIFEFSFTSFMKKSVIKLIIFLSNKRECLINRFENKMLTLS